MSAKRSSRIVYIIKKGTHSTLSCDTLPPYQKSYGCLGGKYGTPHKSEGSKVQESEGSLVRRFFSPKVHKLEIKGSAVRTKRFWSLKVQYSEILKKCDMKLFHNPSFLTFLTFSVDS